MSLTYDLAYVRSALPENDSRAALDRVEAEIARLQRHPDAWSQEAFDQQKQRAEDAEAEIARLEQEREARDDAELIGHAQDARDAAKQRYGQGFFPGPTPMERQMADDEYSPEHQDEYQRLWHRDAAEVARLRDGLRELDRDYHWVIAEPDPDAGKHLHGCPGCFARSLLAEDGPR